MSFMLMLTHLNTDLFFFSPYPLVSHAPFQEVDDLGDSKPEAAVEISIISILQTLLGDDYINCTNGQPM